MWRGVSSSSTLFVFSFEIGDTFSRNANMTISCPVDKGDHDVTQTVELPKEIPRGLFYLFDLKLWVTTYPLLAKFVVEVHGYSVDDADLMCINININFMSI